MLYNILLPVVLGFCLLGAYACSNSITDVLMALVFGVIGYIFPKFDFPTTPMLIALVLGPIAERSLVQSMVLSDGSALIFFTRPISILFFCLSILSVFYSMRQKRRANKNEALEA